MVVVTRTIKVMSITTTSSPVCGELVGLSVYNSCTVAVVVVHSSMGGQDNEEPLKTLHADMCVHS